MNYRISIVHAVGVSVLGLSNCSEGDTNSPTGITSSNSDAGAGAGAGAGSSSVLNNAPANPQAPQNPTGSDPGGSQP